MYEYIRTLPTDIIVFYLDLRKFEQNGKNVIVCHVFRRCIYHLVCITGCDWQLSKGEEMFCHKILKPEYDQKALFKYNNCIVIGTCISTDNQNGSIYMSQA